ncbi:MAG: hypothetical protein SVR08_03265 [Spirochaetota bacterium]|nr:hypothetical protein [Spirochaetota bacterium]
MSDLVKQGQWVWIIVQEKNGNEQFLGQYDNKSNESYIPTFLEKDDALQCINLLTRDKSIKHEIQAIQFEDLGQSASQNGFLLFVLNGEGEVLEKIEP